jgi:hypothetical protein
MWWIIGGIFSIQVFPGVFILRISGIGLPLAAFCRKGVDDA